MIAIVLVLNAAIPWSASIFLLPAIWRRRARFREQLRADIGTAPDFLRDIGIDVPEAQAEAMRFSGSRSHCSARLATQRPGLYRGIRARRRRKLG